MSVSIRDASPSDIPDMVAVLMEGASNRATLDPTLWSIAPDAADQIAAMLGSILSGKGPPFRQKWLVAETEGTLVAVSHSILLPVPPIYAGEFGPPGLIMESTFVAESAPEWLASRLIEAAERDLEVAGAQIILGSSVASGAMEAVYSTRGYRPLTRYFSRNTLRVAQSDTAICLAQNGDIEGLVEQSAVNRETLHRIDQFWKPHPEADLRFHAWMEKSLQLPDRDMYVSKRDGAVTGYCVAQPSSPLHFPTGHDITGVGFIDDWFHDAFADQNTLSDDPTAAALLGVGEAALSNRDFSNLILVCPDGWTSKRELLAAEGYEIALTWFKKN